METFKNLDEARIAGICLGRYGLYPTIYKRVTNEYVLVERNEWPPTNCWPFLKWDGRDWLPILIKLDSLEDAQIASGLFSLLGHNPIIVEFAGITFDIFFKEGHIPSGAWIVSEVESNYSVRYMKLPEDNPEEESDIIEIPPL
ncbi:hypothetical protein EU527_15910 [Candidatus Thorarchaeota archaeon]|nr:MAG: hypothetical protein EU527_15910 [Candidatus Thorarchaeota archaeon]